MADNPTCAGRSITELIENKLDVIITRLTTTPAADGRDPGRAEGLAMALAIIKNPYAPNWRAEGAAGVGRLRARQARAATETLNSPADLP